MRNTRSAADQGADHRARLGHPLRQHQQRGRGPHQLAAKQDRQGVRRAAHSHHPGSRLRAHGYAAMTLTLRARLATISAIVFGLLLAALSLVSYEVLSRRLDADVTERLTELTDGLHGYLRFAATAPRRSSSMRATTIRRRSSTRRRGTSRSTTSRPGSSLPNRVASRRCVCI